MDEVQEKTPLPNPFDLNTKGHSTSSEPQILDGIIHELNHEARDNLQTPNFPYFYPLVYHNINLEISQKRSFLARTAYFFTRSTSLSLLLQFISSFFSYQIDVEGSLSGFHVIKEIFLSLFILFIGTSLIYYVQYYSFYCSIRDETPNSTALPMQVYTIITLSVLVLGIPGTGTIGLIYTYLAFQKGKWLIQFLSVVVTIWQSLNLIGEIIVYFLIRPVFKPVEEHETLIV